METYRLDHPCIPIDVSIRPGMSWLLYSDSGPQGPCAQTMDFTCPYAALHLFSDDDAMRAFMAARGTRRGTGTRIMSGIVGVYTSGGVFSLVLHGDSKEVEE